MNAAEAQGKTISRQTFLPKGMCCQHLQDPPRPWLHSLQPTILNMQCHSLSPRTPSHRNAAPILEQQGELCLASHLSSQSLSWNKALSQLTSPGTIHDTIPSTVSRGSHLSTEEVLWVLACWISKILFLQTLISNQKQLDYSLPMQNERFGSKELASPCHVQHSVHLIRLQKVADCFQKAGLCSKDTHLSPLKSCSGLAIA